MLLQKKKRKKTLLIGSNQLQWVLASGTEKNINSNCIFLKQNNSPETVVVNCLWWMLNHGKPPPPKKKNSCVKNLLCAIYPHYSASVLVQEDSFSRFTACFLYIMSHCLRILEIACVKVCIQHARTKFFWGSGYICFFISFYNFDMIVSYFGHAGTFRGSSNLEKFYWQKNDRQEQMLRFLNKLNFNK